MLFTSKHKVMLSPTVLPLVCRPRTFVAFPECPGGDSSSYGYHGDDGGIFHASGDMLKRFGPPYGKGDTVGCGVDYLNGGIFFTLNGKMLGYGWTGLELHKKELYPTIGVDSNAPVGLQLW